MKRHLLTILTLMVSCNCVQADALKQNIASITARVKIGKTVEVVKQSEPVFSNVIVDFSITPSDSSPPSVVLAGKVVSNNSGGATEFVPIFFGSSLHHPRLAALTNVNGEFRFRVWLKKSRTDNLRLKTPNISDSTLYLDGQFNGKSEMISSYTHIYSLRLFAEQVAK